VTNWKENAESITATINEVCDGDLNSDKRTLRLLDLSIMGEIIDLYEEFMN
jgi:hypothetical protein